MGGGHSHLSLLHSLKLSLVITTKSPLLALAWFFVTMCMYLCLYYHCVIQYMRSYCIIIGLAAIERYIRFQSQNL